jgi:hypothetical protein
MEEVNFHDIKIDNHQITIWADRFVVLRHPEKCDLYEDDCCRERMIKYITDEGYIDPEKNNCIVFDSYIDFEP